MWNIWVRRELMGISARIELLSFLSLFCRWRIGGSSLSSVGCWSPPFLTDGRSAAGAFGLESLFHLACSCICSSGSSSSSYASRGAKCLFSAWSPCRPGMPNRSQCHPLCGGCVWVDVICRGGFRSGEALTVYRPSHSRHSLQRITHILVGVFVQW